MLHKIESIKRLQLVVKEYFIHVLYFYLQIIHLRTRDLFYVHAYYAHSALNLHNRIRYEVFAELSKELSSALFRSITEQID